ncbi:hypothetical protein BOTBODRAFT_249312 [Botryobasidium botryosum FD-172 SS1]|uniref:Uncharacterized protein n=1 Tax=Botryobasidium botryosum (strain FD-172 SS1) TaxID=930990 RepID=A0A067MX53_BOTB1|nr:hypothetical protein BOTBODRAFT_249312 [Botryobasidium botryosum FD-172 SS1]
MVCTLSPHLITPSFQERVHHSCAFPIRDCVPRPSGPPSKFAKLYIDGIEIEYALDSVPKQRELAELSSTDFLQKNCLAFRSSEHGPFRVLAQSFLQFRAKLEMAAFGRDRAHSPLACLGEFSVCWEI